LSREFSLIYNCLTLPSDSLYMSYADENGSEASLPSFDMDRLQPAFRREALPATLSLPAEQRRRTGDGACRLRCGRFFICCSSDSIGRKTRKARQGCGTLRSAANRQRGRRVADAVRSLYGDTLRLSASRVDRLFFLPFRLISFSTA
jgi:hypothetical protein